MISDPEINNTIVIPVVIGASIGDTQTNLNTAIDTAIASNNLYTGYSAFNYSGFDPATRYGTSVFPTTTSTTPVSFNNPSGSADVSSMVVIQGNGITPEETLFTIGIAGDSYLILHSHCNLIKYVFHFSAVAPDLGTPSDVLVYVPVVAGITTGDVQTVVSAQIFETFKEISDLYSCYLGCLTETSKLEDVQKVLLSFCSVLRDRIKIDRTLNKTMLTIGRCDL
jgi:hypothetical protein